MQDVKGIKATPIDKQVDGEEEDEDDDTDIDTYCFCTKPESEDMIG